MTGRSLLRRSLSYYWRSHLAVVAGVAVAVAVLAGALLVGESVRGTLRDLAVGRLGATDVVVVSSGFMREQLAGDIRRDSTFGDRFTEITPLIALEGFVTAQGTSRRVGRVKVYGVDDRFWRFHSSARVAPLGERQAYVSEALAADLGAAVDAPILVRVELPTDVPLESLHGRKDDPGRTMRATVQQVLAADAFGEFSLSPEQGSIRAVFLPLDRVQRELDLERRINTLLVDAKAETESSADALGELVHRAMSIEDAGLSIRARGDGRTVIVNAEGGLIDAARSEVVRRTLTSAGLEPEPVLTYLVNAMRVRGREVPYSLVTARDLSRVLPEVPSAEPAIVFNEWAAKELAARPGDEVELEYLVWEDPGRLVTRSERVRVAGVVPLVAADRDLAPDYPGITDSPSLDSWNPPFPLDLSRVRPVDEAYWDRFRTTPKAFIALEHGQKLWGSRYGSITSIRATVPDGREAAEVIREVSASLRSGLDRAASGLFIRAVRADALAAAMGVTDFGAYFTYFSFFIVVSALVLVALFFKLGVDQRAKEIGLLGAVGASVGFVRTMFMTEAAVLAGLGSALGVVGAVAYAGVIVRLLRTRWVDAVGTSALALHVSPSQLAIGALGGLAAALLCTWFALRGLRRISPRALIAGGDTTGMAGSPGRASRWLWASLSTTVLAAIVIALGVTGAAEPAGAFFGGAFLMLLAGVAALSFWYRRPAASIGGRGLWSLWRLGVRNAAAKPARSALAVSVIASATFILVAVDAFRKSPTSDADPASGLGGYALLMESLVPIVHDLRTTEGREALGLTGLDGVNIDPFRLRPGDDASCLNLYQPTRPRVLGVTRAFAARDRFSFRASMAETDAERSNPWLLLQRRFDDGAVPVVADANSLTYVLHTSVGDDLEIEGAGGRIRLRVVAALADSVFQRELLMDEAQFLRVFPEHEGYRVALVEAAGDRAAEVGRALEDQLSAFAVDVTSTGETLAQFHRVENTFIATFQTLGGLGLLVGTMGLGAVLLRSVIERRRELALLGAVGYRPHHVRVILLAESTSLLMAGLLIGVAAAVVATLPALLERGGRAPVSTTGVVLVALVMAAGLIATVLATRAATRQPLLEALRSE